MSLPLPATPQPFPTHPMPTGPIRSGTVRVGEVERSRVCSALSAHFAAGRLTGDELEVRLGAATAAITRDDLHDVLVDLPAVVAVAPRQVPIGPARDDAARVAGDVVVAMATAGAGLVCGLMLLAALFGFDGAVFFFSLVGGTFAAVTGAGLVHLAHRWRARAAARPGQG